MAHLMADDENLFVPNDGYSPTRKAAEASVVDDTLLSRGICETCREERKRERERERERVTELYSV